MAKQESVLEPIEAKIEITTKKFDPKEFFKDREGLYVWNRFIDRIVDKAEPIELGLKLMVSSSKLTDSATDDTIESSLPEKHVFTESEVCAIVADLIEKQPKGEEGTLINNGYANLFYTPSFVVSVDWYGGRWHVFTWVRDGVEWFGGSRVFSPVN